MLDGEQIALLEEARSALPDRDAALIALVTARLSVASRWSPRVTPPGPGRRGGQPGAGGRGRRGARRGAGRAVRRHRRPGSPRGAAAARHRDHRDRGPARRPRCSACSAGGCASSPGWRPGAITDREADVVAYQAAAQALRHPLYTWYVPLWRGMRALAEGRFADCAAALAQAAETGERAGSANAEMLVVTQRWFLLADAADTAGAGPARVRAGPGRHRGHLPGDGQGARCWPRSGGPMTPRARFDAVAPLVAVDAARLGVAAGPDPGRRDHRDHRPAPDRPLDAATRWSPTPACSRWRASARRCAGRSTGT